MTRLYLVPIDLNQNEIRNVRFQNLASAPSSPVVGQVYHDTALLASYIWNGTYWANTDARKLVAQIPNGALTTNPLDRNNHTGSQTASTISDLATVVKAYKLSDFAAPTANIPMAGFTFSGLNTSPNAAGQAAEYSWVIGQLQAAAAGITSRPPVRAVATTNITLSAPQTIDGVAVIAGDRVLAVGQTTATQNGVYVVAAGAWVRAVTEDQANEISAGAMWLVTEGTGNTGTQWREATTGTIVVGTTPLSIVQFAAAGSYTAGNGMTLVGSAFTAVAAPSGGIVVSGSGIAVDPTYVTRKFSATIGDGSATSFTVTHSLGTQDVVIIVRQAGTPFSVVECDMAATSTTTATIAFTTAPTTNQFRVTVLG